MVFLWIIIFIASLALLVKSADWLVENSEKIGLFLKMPSFIIGVTIVAIGTSFPELAATLTATLKGNTEFVADTAFGSNIATILLIVGIAAVAARRLTIKRSLIDLDAPLLAVSTVLIMFMVRDKKIVLWEGIILILAFFVYILYTIFHKREEDTPEIVEVLPSRVERRKAKVQKKIKTDKEPPRPKLDFGTFLFLVLGIIGLVIGANYTVESVTRISELVGISASFITITAVAVGTSLPELVVSIRAALRKKYEIALGNVFGSNVFTIFLIIGLPALIRPLKINEITFSVGLPYLIVATFLFVISGISRRIHLWEGAMYLLIYTLFVCQFFGLF